MKKGKEVEKNTGQILGVSRHGIPGHPSKALALPEGRSVMHLARTNGKFHMLFPPSPGCSEDENLSTSSFHLFLPGAILNSVTRGGITQQRGESGLFQANSSGPAAWEWEWANGSLTLLSTTERTKPEENFACHAVVINSKCKIFLLVWFRKYCWMSFKLCRVMTSKYQFCDWKILIFLNP